MPKNPLFIGLLSLVVMPGILVKPQDINSKEVVNICPRTFRTF